MLQSLSMLVVFSLAYDMVMIISIKYSLTFSVNWSQQASFILSGVAGHQNSK